MGSSDMSPVGMIGLGIMGSAMSANMVASGRTVIGFDPDSQRLGQARAGGVTGAGSIREVAERAAVLFTSLPSDAALSSVAREVVSAAIRPEAQTLVELSTLSLAAKQRERDALADAGVAMLDCPVSGTGAQAAARDIVLFVSGQREAYERVRPVFSSFARDAVYLGAFGNGMRMKLVANLLVAIHNVAAAEAILLGLRCGLDAETLVSTLAGGAGGSRMLQVRGPLMVRQSFEPATMKLDVWQKDMALIAEFAREEGVATPLFDATAPLYAAALAEGRGQQDTAAVYAILEKLSPTARLVDD
jgi:3-hydroxyisobutyrate dehydrogenase-like beta-hydroxyacid dehydrogenase